MRNGSRISTRLFWGAFVLSVVACSVALPFVPIHWQDEVQVNEIGRACLPGCDLSWNMQIRDGIEPVPTPWTSAVVFSEWAYQLFGSNGPRIVSLAFLLLAILVLRYHVLRKTQDVWLGNLLPLFLFVVPLLRVGRVEPLAFFYLFGSMAAIHLSFSRLGHWKYFLSGALAACCALSWATSILLIPIVLDELYNQFLIVGERAHRAKGILLFVLGGLLVSVLLLLPFAVGRTDVVGLIRQLSASDVKIGSSAPLLEFIGYFKMFMGVYVLGAVCCIVCCRRHFILAGGAAIFLLVCVTSRVYEFRMLYFLPYALTSFVCLLEVFHARWLRRCFFCILSSMLIVLGLQSVIRRGLCGVLGEPYWDYGVLAKQFATLVDSAGPVYSHTFNTYYIGRQLGWKQYQLDFQRDTLRAGFLSGMRYFVVEERAVDTRLLSLLHESGFTKYSEVKFPDVKLCAMGEAFRARGLISAPGPYRVYSK